MNAHEHVIFHFFKKWSRHSERVCKNAQEKCNFSDFFTYSQTEKIRIYM